MFYSILLAGGKSSRMGQDKSRLKVNDETLLQRSLNLLKSCGSESILISGDIEGYQSVPDLLPECGPLGGIYSCLRLLRDEGKLDNSSVLIIPVDMPLLTSAAINRIVLEGEGVQCCHYENEVFPCLMKASEALYDYLEEAFKEDTTLGGKRSMKGLMKYLNAHIISGAGLPENVFINMNSPEDWKKLEL